MLVKARFITQLHQENELDYRYLFALSVEDGYLLGVNDAEGQVLYRDESRQSKAREMVRPTDRQRTPTSYSYGGDLKLVLDENEIQRLFVVEMTFPPERREMEREGEEASAWLNFIPGQLYWVMVQGVFGELGPEKRPHNAEQINLPRSPHLILRVRGAGIYSLFSAQELIHYGQLMADAGSLEAVFTSPGQAEGIDPFVRIRADRARMGEDPNEPITDIDAEMLQRLVGSVLSMPITDEILEEGHDLYDNPQDLTIPQGLIPLYQLWARAQRVESGNRRRGGPIQAEGNRVMRGQPSIDTISDFSNPSEYGSYGQLFILAVLMNPYRFVGPASSPGVGPMREGSGIQLGFPFWMIDIIGQALYGVEETGERAPLNVVPEPLHEDRSGAVARETFRHLETRNLRAFRSYLPSGQISEGGDFEFDLEAGPGFYSPAGSTVFWRKTVDRALVLRHQDLRRMINRQAVAFFGDSRWPNPFQAYAGFAGCRLYPFRYLERPENRNFVVESVSTMSNHPVQIEDARPDIREYEFRSLRARSAVEEAIASRVLDTTVYTGPPKIYDPMEVLEPGEPVGILDVSLPVIRNLDEAIREDELQLTPSQAEAALMSARWPISVVTGNPGAGKTFLMMFTFQMMEFVTRGAGWFLVLAPTNRAAARLAERLSGLVREDPRTLVLLGGNQKLKQEVQPKIIVGTVDAFIARVNASPRFREMLRSRDGFVAIDEASMVTPSQFRTVMDYLDPVDESREMTDYGGRLLRAIIVGDPYQLSSVEPGNFLHDLMRVLPTTRLREQMRSAVGEVETEETRQGLGLESFFDLVRSSMDHSDDRALVVRYLLAHAMGEDPQTSSHPLIERGAITREELSEAYRVSGLTKAREEFRRRRLDPVTESGSRYTTVNLMNDLPSPGIDFDGSVPTAAQYRQFMIYRLNEEVRNQVFRAVLKWRGVTFREVLSQFGSREIPDEVHQVVNQLAANLEDTNANPIPFTPERYGNPRSPIERTITEVYRYAFRQVELAFTSREPSFKVITMYRVPQSVTQKTDFISSSERVNGWFHDFLLGLIPPPEGTIYPESVPDPRSAVRFDDSFYRDYISIRNEGIDPRDPTAGKIDPELRRAKQMEFLYRERPEHVMLCPNWPYIVLRNDFRSMGIFRGETVYYLGAITVGADRAHRFVSESGNEMVIAPRFCQPKYLSYGWATNVHQVQGGEYPLIIMLWLSGIPHGGDFGIQRNWDAIRPQEGVTAEFQRIVTPTPQELGAADDRLDIRAFYTGITRTKANWRLPIPDPETGNPFQTGRGQCTIITGLHALRQFLNLQVRERATGFAGRLLALMESKEGA